MTSRWVRREIDDRMRQIARQIFTCKCSQAQRKRDERTHTRTHTTWKKSQLELTESQLAPQQLVCSSPDLTLPDELAFQKPTRSKTRIKQRKQSLGQDMSEIRQEEVQKRRRKVLDIL